MLRISYHVTILTLNKCAFIRIISQSSYMATADEGEIPPLEDMSAELDRLKSRTKLDKASEPNTEKKQAAIGHKKRAQDGFGGFKKGFLSSSSSEKKSAVKKPCEQTVPSAKAEPNTTKELPYIKKSQASGLELPEVQEAMKNTFPFLEKNDWVTEDLLSKVEKHPNLSKVFQDPALSQLLVEFQKDPKKAMAAVQDNKEMRGFLQDFCSLMGDHFTQLADQEEKANPANGKKAPLITNVDEPSTKDKVKEILAKPEVRQLLQDKEVQTLLHLLKTNPEAAHRMSRSANRPLQEKIKLLVQNGLLAMQ